MASGHRLNQRISAIEAWGVSAPSAARVAARARTATLSEWPRDSWPFRCSSDGGNRPVQVVPLEGLKRQSMPKTAIPLAATPCSQLPLSRTFRRRKPTTKTRLRPSQSEWLVAATFNVGLRAVGGRALIESGRSGFGVSSDVSGRSFCRPIPRPRDAFDIPSKMTRNDLRPLLKNWLRLSSPHDQLCQPYAL